MLQDTLNSIKQDKGITEANKANIPAWLEDAKSRGLTATRQLIIAHHLRRLAKFTKTDFKTFTPSDSKALMKALESSKYGEWVKVTCKKLFKQMMRSYKLPEDVYSWIVAGNPPNRLKKEDLLNPEEVSFLVSNAPNMMWKALLSLLIESGCRPGEALNLTIGSVMLNTNHVKIYVSGKMARSAGERPLFLFKSYEVIKAWLEQHPLKKDANAPLWITRQNTPLSLHTLNIEFKRISKKAGITKRCYPYLLRHVKGTEVYVKYAPAIAMKLMGHNNAKTGMTYTHLAEEDVLNALQQENGIKPKQNEVQDADRCQQCGSLNGFGSLQCTNCHAALGAAGAIQIETEQRQFNKKFERLAKLLETPAGTKWLEQIEAEALKHQA